MQRMDNNLAITRPKLGQGLLGSLILHGLGFLLFTALTFHRQAAPPHLQIVPVQIIYLEQGPGAPGQAKPASPAGREAHARPAVHTTPARVSTTRTSPRPDALDTQLQSLSKARLSTRPATSMVDNAGSPNGGAARQGGHYTLRDYIRAQVERRWSLDIQKTGNLAMVVSIAIEITADGTITKAQIVDSERAAVDRAYRDLAISARNAVLLSSPITLPPGQYKPVMQLTLDLDPKKTLR